MPQGCDFICRNEDCRNFEASISMHGVWPLKDIDEAIADSEGERKTALEARKSEGRKSSLFVYPQDKEKTPKGYRIQLYCKKDRVRHEFEFDTSEEAVAAESNPCCCPNCGDRMCSVKLALKEGLPCPSCGTTTEPNWWFTK